MILKFYRTFIGREDNVPKEEVIVTKSHGRFCGREKFVQVLDLLLQVLLSWVVLLAPSCEKCVVLWRIRHYSSVKVSPPESLLDDERQSGSKSINFFDAGTTQGLVSKEKPISDKCSFANSLIGRRWRAAVFSAIILKKEKCQMSEEMEHYFTSTLSDLLVVLWRRQQFVLRCESREKSVTYPITEFTMNLARETELIQQPQV